MYVEIQNMVYIIVDVIVCIIIAALVGIWIGILIWICTREDVNRGRPGRLPIILPNVAIVASERQLGVEAQPIQQIPPAAQN